MGIDARISRSWETGVGRLTLELVEAMARQAPAHQFIVLTLPTSPRLPRPAPNVVQVDVDIAIASPVQALAYSRRTARFELDVIFCTHPLATPVKAGAPSIGLLLDVYPILFPGEYHPVVNLYYRAVYRVAARHQNAIFAISEASRSDGIRHLGLPADRVAVLPLAASRRFRRLRDRHGLAERLARMGVCRDYLLYVGNYRSHKNVAGLLRAYAEARPRLPNTALVLVGGVERGRTGLTEADVTALSAQLGITSDVTQLGVVSDDVLVDLYNGAVATTIPSFYEGFGLPAIEAMACGSPVVASKRGALPEVVHDGGILVDPRDPAALAHALEAIVLDVALRRSLTRRALQQARAFSWDRSASTLLHAIQQVAA